MRLSSTLALSDSRGTPRKAPERASVWSERQLLRLEQRRQLLPAAHALLLTCEGGMALRGALGGRVGAVEGPGLRAITARTRGSSSSLVESVEASSSSACQAYG